MDKRLEKFLEFNGKRIAVLLADGSWWVAIKPICEALGVEYTRAFKNLKEDDFFVGALAKQPMHDATKRLQEMMCIREKEVYGWLCTLRSESLGLKEYKRKCYDILFDHFHGALTGRMTALTEKSDAELRMIELQQRLDEKMLQTEEYREMMELKQKQKIISKKLKDLDAELLTGQLSLNLDTN